MVRQTWFLWGCFSFGLAGCGLTVPRLTEFYDWDDPLKSRYMQLEVKRAIYCELRGADHDARNRKLKRTHRNVDVTTVEDVALPPTWGAQIELSFTVNEKSTLSPSVSIIEPLPNSQSFTFGLGGQLSSEANRIDKFDYYYSMKQLIDDDNGHNTCDDPKSLGHDSASSPFLVRSNLGIREWLIDAVVINSQLRSSRSEDTGIGKALGEKSDSFSYDIKFAIVSSGNITPTWKLVRISTASSPLLDEARTRTHELLITIGPGAKADFRRVVDGVLPFPYYLPGGSSLSAAIAHNNAAIGGAVARSRSR